MKNSSIKRAALVLALAGTGLAGMAQSKINVVTTAVPFLRISPDARAGGMGDMGIATSADASSSYYNLAKVPFAERANGLNVTYTPWMKNIVQDVYLASAAGYHKLDETQALTGSLRYFSLGQIQFSDQYGNLTSTGRPREWGIDLGYARKLSDKTGVGIALKYIYSNLAGGASSAAGNYRAGRSVAGDIGFYHNRQNGLGQGWSFGAALTNLGAKVSYTDNANAKDFIPANLGLGTTYSFVLDESNKITVGLELNKLLVPTPPEFVAGQDSLNAAKANAYRNKSVVGSWGSSFGDAPGGASEEAKEFQVSMGAEYWYNNQFALRAGYFFEDASKGSRKYLTAGVGVKYNVFGLNFSYLVPTGGAGNQNPLSNTLRFSVLFDLGGSTALQEKP